MSRSATTTLWIVRDRSVCWIDEDNRLQVERQECEIEVDITASMNAAEPDAGIMGPWAEDICATGPDGEIVLLTEAEEEQAGEKLSERRPRWASR